MTDEIVNLEQLDKTIEKLDTICNGILNKEIAPTGNPNDNGFLFRRLDDGRQALKSFRRVYLMLGVDKYGENSQRE